MELTIQPAVLDGRGHLPGYRREQRQVLAVERFVGVLASKRQHGDRPAFKDARHEVIDPGVTPELDFLGHEPRRGNGIVERDGVARVQARDERGVAPERWHWL